MSLYQQAAQRNIVEVIVSADQKFMYIDQVVAQTRPGIDGVSNFAQQL